MLAQEQIAAYQDQGFTLVENALTTQQLLQLQEITADYLEQSRQVTESDNVFDLDAGHSATSPRLTRIKTPHLQHPAFWEVLRGERITGLLKSLLGPDIRLHNSKLNTKAGHGGTAVQWHQDWGFYPHTNDDMLAIGIMLSDVTEEDGPLLVVPGSHKGPVLPHTNNGTFCGAIDPAHPDAHLDQAVPVLGKAGDMSIHHVRLLHGSAPNLSDKNRLLLFFECGAADAWPLNGNQSVYTGLDSNAFWDGLCSRMICGEQTMTPRLEPVPVLMPLPPAPDGGSIFKVQESGGAVDAFA